MSCSISTIWRFPIVQCFSKSFQGNVTNCNLKHINWLEPNVCTSDSKIHRVSSVIFIPHLEFCSSFVIKVCRYYKSIGIFLICCRQIPEGQCSFFCFVSINIDSSSSDTAFHYIMSRKIYRKYRSSHCYSCQSHYDFFHTKKSSV